MAIYGRGISIQERKIDNIVPACKSCNSKKNNKSLLLFMLQEVSIWPSHTT